MQQTRRPGPGLPSWATVGLTAVALAAIGGVALAGSTGPSPAAAPAVARVAAQDADADPGEGEAPKAGHAVENHGRCVSYWNHRAKEMGLHGKAKADFKRPIAEDESAVASKDELTDTCRFGGALGKAVDHAGEDGSLKEPKATGKPDREAKLGKPDKPGKPEGTDDEDADAPSDEQTNPLL